MYLYKITRTGFGKAVEVAVESMEKKRQRIRTLRNRLYEGIRKSLAMGIPANMTRSAIRLSPGRDNTEEDID